jgi:hypothetical protein
MTSSTRITGLPDDVSRYLCGTLVCQRHSFCAVRGSAQPDFYYGGGVAEYFGQMFLAVQASAPAWQIVYISTADSGGDAKGSE